MTTYRVHARLETTGFCDVEATSPADAVRVANTIGFIAPERPDFVEATAVEECDSSGKHVRTFEGYWDIYEPIETE